MQAFSLQALVGSNINTQVFTNASLFLLSNNTNSFVFSRPTMSLFLK